MTAPEAAHEVAALLPWYLNATLTPAESRTVEEHLTTCASCREEAERWRGLRPALATTVESRPAPPADLFASVLSRIEASERVRTAASEPWWQRLASTVFDLVPARLAPATALAVIVLQFGALGVVGTVAYRALRDPVSVTQSGPEGRPAVPGAVRLRVAFQDTATARDLRALLQRLDAHIVEGPTAAGFYIMEAPAIVESRPVLDTLQGSTDLIRFAEPVAPGPH